MLQKNSYKQFTFITHWYGKKNALYDKWNDDDDDDGYRAEDYLRSKTGGWRLGKRRGGRFEIVIGCRFRGVTLGGGTGGGMVSSGGPLKICKHQKWQKKYDFVNLLSLLVSATE